ncbi:MAG: hypothetical protein AAFN12_05345 [Cyanobacteria bacterium J06560_2]
MQELALAERHFLIAVLKRPMANDFRVQEIYGGSVEVIAPERAMVAIAKQAIAALKERLLQARADSLRLRENDSAIAELKLIEPNLSLRTNSKAPMKFAYALLE